MRVRVVAIKRVVTAMGVRVVATRAMRSVLGLAMQEMFERKKF